MENELISVLNRMAVTLEEIREIADRNVELNEKVAELEMKVKYLEERDLNSVPTPLREDNDDWWKKEITAVAAESESVAP